ncbi:37S ribosomal protein S7, mitochondrial [Grifola frondosa]|uniref:37S ribosomal protein S7, mitochondrial n=1 Tax=Grifola frondosa TaxID=5627 RepID=A0A1C7MRP6_GRIFR|nr:37S ribosomal protein S7, mitochondrial [Grifola frondosa]
MRSTRRYMVRGLSTTTDASGQTVEDALSKVGSLLQGETSSPGLASSAPAPVRTAWKPEQPSVINIPPAEDPLLHYLTSFLMSNGKREKAAKISSRILLHLHAFTRAPPMPILRQAIFEASPAVRCISFSRSSKTTVIPVALSEKQRTRYALTWILKASDSKMGQTLEERFARELIAVVKGDSDALKKKKEVHQYAVLHRGNVPRGARAQAR